MKSEDSELLAKALNEVRGQPLNEKNLKLMKLANEEIEELQKQGYKIRKISEEIAQDLSHFHNVDAVSELIGAIAQVIALEDNIKSGMDIEQASREAAKNPYIFNFMKKEGSND